MEKDSGNAVNRYGNEDFYFCSAGISSVVVIFSCWFLAALVILIVVLCLFFKLIHSPAIPHPAVKKIIPCIAINQPPVVASKREAVCF